MQATRPKGSSKFEAFHDGYRAIAVAGLQRAIADYHLFGIKRYRQRCLTGRDWKREYRGEPKNYVGTHYRDLREKITWLHSYQFGLWADTLNLDVEQLQTYFRKLLMGPEIDDGVLHRHD
jgi:hypothetical protein